MARDFPTFRVDPGAADRLRSSSASNPRMRPRPMYADLLTIDGSHAEGGGQILRTALSLAMITGSAIRLVNVRSARRNPGLAPQHVSAVRAAAAISGADVVGDRLGSTELSFAPDHRPRAGSYVFDVAATAEHGSAGSVTLLLQTLLLPLALAAHASTLILHGGTHVAWSPPFDGLASTYVPALRRMGFGVDFELKRWGWYPAGGGEIVCNIAGQGSAASGGGTWPRPFDAITRGPLRRISGRAVAANLPAYIPQRMADRARGQLAELGIATAIEPQRVTAACAGAGIFLSAERWRRASPPTADSGSRRRRSPTKRSQPSENTTLPGPPSNCTSPTSCCYRSRWLPGPRPSRSHTRRHTSSRTHG